MLHGSFASLFAAFVPLIATESAAEEASWIGREATRSRITVIDVDGSKPKVVFDSPHRYAAPEWTPDGASLIVNGGGKLWRLPASGGTPTPIPTGSAPWIDINHAVSPDGKSLAFTAGSIWKVPATGGEPMQHHDRVGGSYVHGWSPDGKWLVFSSNRGHGLDLFTISADGRSDQQADFKPSGGRRAPVIRRTGAGSTSSLTAAAPETSGGCPPPVPARATARPSRSPATIAKTPLLVVRPTASGSSICLTRRAPTSTPSTATS